MKTKVDENHRFVGKVTPELYTKAKTLLGIGIFSEREIAEKLDVSQTTIRNIKSSIDFEDYKNKIKDDFSKIQKNETKKGVDTKEILFQQQVLGMIREQNSMILSLIKTMELVSNKITAIVDQLT